MAWPWDRLLLCHTQHVNYNCYANHIRVGLYGVCNIKRIQKGKYFCLSDFLKNLDLNASTTLNSLSYANTNILWICLHNISGNTALLTLRIAAIPPLNGKKPQVKDVPQLEISVQQNYTFGAIKIPPIKQRVKLTKLWIRQQTWHKVESTQPNVTPSDQSSSDSLHSSTLQLTIPLPNFHTFYSVLLYVNEHMIIKLCNLLY